jgi:hypothetical protein
MLRLRATAVFMDAPSPSRSFAAGVGLQHDEREKDAARLARRAGNPAVIGRIP